MPSIDEEIARLQKLKEKGRGAERCTPARIPTDDAKARVENAGPKPKTKFSTDTDSDKIYSRLNAAKDRVIRVIENKTVAFEILTTLWERPTDDELHEMAKGD